MAGKSSTRRANGHTQQIISPPVTRVGAANHSANGTTDTAELAPEQLLLATLPAMLFTSRPDGAWDYVNPSFCAHTGHPEQALTGLGWAELLHADDRASTLAQWQAAIKSGAACAIEHRLRGADGVYRRFRTQYAPQRNAAGAITRWAGIVAPAESEHQVAVERTLRQSAEQSRDEHKSVIAIVAHELRAPLTVLLGQAKLLQSRLEVRTAVDPGDKRAADTLVSQTLRLRDLMSALLDLTRIDHGQLYLTMATLDLGALVRQVVLDLQPTMPSHRLRLRADWAPLWVAGDGLRLEQVLQNLLQNAVKYSPAGSEIIVSLAQSGDQVRLSVCDYGVGIAASDQTFLFQPFFRTTPGQASKVPGPGLGLGLYICKAIVDLHGGNIEVESAEGEGCTVTLLLPRIQLEPLHSRPDATVWGA